MISICSISMSPSFQGSVQLHDYRGEKNLSKLITWICVHVQSCRLRKEKQFSRLPLLLGILLATWHSAWMILTDAWHIRYRRSKIFISWLQFLYIKSKSIEPNILPSEFLCAYVQHMCSTCVYYLAGNMQAQTWEKFSDLSSMLT